MSCESVRTGLATKWSTMINFFSQNSPSIIEDECCATMLLHAIVPTTGYSYGALSKPPAPPNHPKGKINSESIYISFDYEFCWCYLIANSSNYGRFTFSLAQKYFVFCSKPMRVIAFTLADQR